MAAFVSISVPSKCKHMDESLKKGKTPGKKKLYLVSDNNIEK